ncbi:MAG: sigma-54-dependent transcriptional regulator [Phycisphaerales bacterium JB064]
MAERASVLVVDDAEAMREIISRNLTALGYDVRVAADVPAALSALGAQPADLVVTDMRMPGADGLDLVRQVRERWPATALVMVTGFATVGGAVQAMREGVSDYLAKPFSDEELEHAVRTALDRRRPALAGSTHGPANSFGMIGQSPAMRRVYRLVERAAGARVPVLITGESGTGKELVARAIHQAGPRSDGPFVPVNAAAIPEALFESELFGHAKGAFTGAGSARQGAFVAADGGTLLLDEVGELPALAQAKLLRVLQDQRVRPVGEDREHAVDVRIIAATNRDLEAMARLGDFRQDLFFRLHVLPIELPPLREREGDVDLLLRAFLEDAAGDSHIPTPSPGVIEALRRYAWPGNVRELRNLAERLVVLADGGSIELDDLPEAIRTAPARTTGPADNRPLRDVELDHIRAVLERAGGNKTRAAEILGIDRKSLREKLKAAERAGPAGAG